MSKQTELKGLDTIITLLRVTLKDRERIENDLKVVNGTIEHLKVQAHAALEGTGLSLTLEELKPQPTIEHWTDLRIGDLVKVKPYGCFAWDERTVVEVEPDHYDGLLVVRVSSELSSGKSWIDCESDQWEFVSRP